MGGYVGPQGELREQGEKILACASRIPNSLAASRIEATLRGA